MTGTQSLSRAQLETIYREAQRNYPPARGLEHFADNIHVRPDEAREASIGAEPGSVVTIVIHQSLQKADGRKRVQLHRAYADSIAFGVLRDGAIIPSSQAA